MKSILLIFIFSISLISAEKNPNSMSEEELLNEIMKMEEEVKVEKEKTKAIKKLGETVDKVAKKLGIEDWYFLYLDIKCVNI